MKKVGGQERERVICTSSLASRDVSDDSRSHAGNAAIAASAAT